MWLQQAPQIQTVMSVGQMMFLLQQTPGLIVLDGLERVQQDGQRGEFGRLSSPKLRDFLNQLASGIVPELSVLITSRFPLADLRDKHSQFFRTIAVDKIDAATGIALLRQRGVRGTDLQLAPVVEHCGRHALTVDFAGGYIAEYGNGDPATPLELGTSEELEAASEQDELDDQQREVLRQGYRFARIAEHYRDAMLKKDEASMALLERICLFRLGVDRGTLAAIFTGDQAVDVSGAILAALNADHLQSKLDWLVRMRIVEATSRPEQAQRSSGSDTKKLPEQRSACSGLRYSIHPAVRDGFLSGISRDAAVAGHEAVRKVWKSLSATPPARIRPIPPRSTCWKRSSTTRSSPATSAKPGTSTRTGWASTKTSAGVWARTSGASGSAARLPAASLLSPLSPSPVRTRVGVRVTRGSGAAQAARWKPRWVPTHRRACALPRQQVPLFSTCPKPRRRSSSTTGRCI